MNWTSEIQTLRCAGGGETTLRVYCSLRGAKKLTCELQPKNTSNFCAFIINTISRKTYLPTSSPIDDAWWVFPPHHVFSYFRSAHSPESYALHLEKQHLSPSPNYLHDTTRHAQACFFLPGPGALAAATSTTIFVLFAVVGRSTRKRAAEGSGPGGFVLRCANGRVGMYSGGSRRQRCRRKSR